MEPVLYSLDDVPPTVFPDPNLAWDEPNGLLAVGGDLSPTRLLSAYSLGIFPWYSEGEPIYWWSPAPRAVFDTAAFKPSRRDTQSLRKKGWQIKADTAFSQVIQTCAKIPRAGQPGTWITDDMIAAYTRLHQLGHAHCVEAWDGDALIGGIYGIGVGRMFFGESMFSLASGGSKAALLGLCHFISQHGGDWLDAQVVSSHLLRLGVMTLDRTTFQHGLTERCQGHVLHGSWQTKLNQPLTDLL